MSFGNCSSSISSALQIRHCPFCDFISTLRERTDSVAETALAYCAQMSDIKRALVDLSELPTVQDDVHLSVSSHVWHRASSDPLLGPVLHRNVSTAHTLQDTQRQVLELKQCADKQIRELQVSSEQSSYAIRGVVDRQEFTVSQANSLVCDLEELFISVQNHQDAMKLQSAQTTSELHRLHDQMVAELKTTQSKLQLAASQMHNANSEVLGEIHLTQKQMVKGWGEEQVRSQTIAQAVIETKNEVINEKDRARTKDEKLAQTNDRPRSSTDIPGDHPRTISSLRSHHLHHYCQ